MKKNKFFALIVTLLTTAILIAACSEGKKEQTKEKKQTKEISKFDTSYQVGDNYLCTITDSSMIEYYYSDTRNTQYINCFLKNKKGKIIWGEKIENGSCLQGKWKRFSVNFLINQNQDYYIGVPEINPRITILDEAQAICFGIDLKSSIIVPQNGNGDTLAILPNGAFVDIPGKYYFYKGDEFLLVLNKNNLECIDTITGIKKIIPHNDKFALLYLDDKRFMIYDLIKPQILVNKISQKECNMSIKNPNQKIFESLDPMGNLIKVSFSNNGKKLTTLLKSKTMSLCTDYVYEDIIWFDNDLAGIINPENLNDKIVTQGETSIKGTIGNAKGSFSSETHGLFNHGSANGSYEYNGDVNLLIKKYEEQFPEKSFKIWKVISIKTGKETGEVYIVDINGTKTKIN